MSLRFHEIAEADHRILNPFSEEKMMLLGEVCRLRAGQRQLDLACETLNGMLAESIAGGGAELRIVRLDQSLVFDDMELPSSGTLISPLKAAL